MAQRLAPPWPRPSSWGCTIQCSFWNLFFKWKYSWFAMLYWLLLYSKMSQLYTHIPTFVSYSFPLQIVIGCWIQFSELCSRTSLFIHSVYKSLHLLIPNFQSVLLPVPLPPWGLEPQVCSPSAELLPLEIYQSNYLLDDNLETDDQFEIIDSLYRLWEELGFCSQPSQCLSFIPVTY